MDENENNIQETAMDFLFQTAPKQTSMYSECILANVNSATI